MRSSRLGMRSSRVCMRSSRVVRASGCHCLSRNSPGFDPSILRHSGIWGAAYEACWITYRKNPKNPPLRIARIYAVIWKYHYVIQGVTKRCRLSWLTKIAPSYMSPKWGEGGVAESQPMSTAVHRSPDKLWRSKNIFNLWRNRTASNLCTFQPELVDLFTQLTNRKAVGLIRWVLYKHTVRAKTESSQPFFSIKLFRVSLNKNFLSFW